MTLTVAPLQDAVGIRIQRSHGEGEFHLDANLPEAGAIYDAIHACLSKGSGSDRGPYEGQPDRGLCALGLDQLRADHHDQGEPVRVFAQMTNGDLVLRFALPKRWGALDLRGEEGRNVLAALHDAAAHIANRHAGN